MWDLEIEEPLSLSLRPRPRRRRGHGRSTWLVRGAFLSAHLAMAYAVLTWLEAARTPPGAPEGRESPAAVRRP